MINAIQIKQKSIYSSISSIRVEFFHDFWKISNKMIYFWSIFGHFGPKLVKNGKTDQKWPKMALFGLVFMKNHIFWYSTIKLGIFWGYLDQKYIFLANKCNLIEYFILYRTIFKKAVIFDEKWRF